MKKNTLLVAVVLAVAVLLVVPGSAQAQLDDTATWASHLSNTYRVVPNVTYGTANNRLMKIVRTRFDTDPGQQSSSFGEPTGGDLLSSGGGGVTAAAPGGGFPPPEVQTKLWTKYYVYDRYVTEDDGNVVRVITKLENPAIDQKKYSATRFVYALNAKAVTFVLGEDWDWS